MSQHIQRGKSFVWLFVWMLTGLPVGAQEGRISDVIEYLVDDATGPYQQELKEVYAQRQYQPLWEWGVERRGPKNCGNITERRSAGPES